MSAATRSLGNSGDDGRGRDATGAVASSERTVHTERTGGTRHDRQHDEFGGFSWGSAFFGWLVAVGMAALLMALLSAIGAATGLTEVSATEARQSAETIGIVGGILLLAVLALAYYCGGYVAGRLARFDGARQGFGVWLFALLVTIALAAAGAILGSEYNVLAQLNLPRIPVDEGALTTGGIIALVAVVLVTVLSAIAGGKVGEKFHRKVDRVGTDRVSA
jgi:hypothetical protein